MRHFVLVYDQERGELESPIESFDDANSATARRFTLERAHRDRPRFEVVMITADSEAAIRQSHMRYFCDPNEILEGVAALAPSGLDPTSIR